jgi:hypothetical protein
LISGKIVPVGLAAWIHCFCGGPEFPFRRTRPARLSGTVYCHKG